MNPSYIHILPSSWNQGGALFAELAQSLCPHLDVCDLSQIGQTLFGSPAYVDWQEAAVSPRSILTTQATIVAMLVQSLTERAEWALQGCGAPQADQGYVAACSVIKAAMRYAPGNGIAQQGGAK